MVGSGSGVVGAWGGYEEPAYTAVGATSDAASAPSGRCIERRDGGPFGVTGSPDDALTGAVVAALAALPFVFLPATAGVVAFAGMGGLSVGLGALTAGAGRYVAPRGL